MWQVLKPGKRTWETLLSLSLCPPPNIYLFIQKTDLQRRGKRKIVCLLVPSTNGQDWSRPKPGTSPRSPLCTGMQVLGCLLLLSQICYQGAAGTWTGTYLGCQCCWQWLNLLSRRAGPKTVLSWNLSLSGVKGQQMYMSQRMLWESEVRVKVPSNKCLWAVLFKQWSDGVLVEIPKKGEQRRCSLETRKGTATSVAGAWWGESQRWEHQTVISGFLRVKREHWRVYDPPRHNISD